SRSRASFFAAPAPTLSSALSLHDALPISLRRTAANSPRLPCSPVSRLRTFAAMFPVLMPRSSSSSRTGEVDGAVPCRDERPAVRRAWAVRSFGVLQPHPVGQLDVLVEAA